MNDQVERAAWVWQGLEASELRERWRRLVAWVQWLEDTYAPWVVLPPCWPAHEAVRIELTILWCWQEALQAESIDPADGLQWHASLRQAAQTWQQLATCDHRPPGPEQQLIRDAHREIRERYVAEQISRNSPT